MNGIGGRFFRAGALFVVAIVFLITNYIKKNYFKVFLFQYSSATILSLKESYRKGEKVAGKDMLGKNNNTNFN